MSRVKVWTFWHDQACLWTSLRGPLSFYKRSEDIRCHENLRINQTLSLFFPFLTQNSWLKKIFLWDSHFEFRLHDSFVNGGCPVSRSHLQESCRRKLKVAKGSSTKKSSFLCQEFCVRNGKNKDKVWLICRFSWHRMRRWRETSVLFENWWP